WVRTERWSSTLSFTSQHTVAQPLSVFDQFGDRALRDLPGACAGERLEDPVQAETIDDAAHPIPVGQRQAVRPGLAAVGVEEPVQARRLETVGEESQGIQARADRGQPPIDGA